MKSTFLVLCILSYVIDSNGQAYFSPTPVDIGSYSVPAYIAGNWKEQKNMDAGKTYTILVNPNQTSQVQIVPNYGVMTPAILSTVNKHIYVSIYEAGGKEQPEGYYIFRLSVINEANVRLSPLKPNLQLPSGNSLKEYLATADTIITEAGYAIWFSNVYKSRNNPPAREGREMNITSKK